MARTFVACLMALVMTTTAWTATPAATNPEVVKGIKQVDDGEYDAAIVTLDSAVRRLQAGGHSPDLAQAYLYLGIAYLGKGHETSAKARFRDAIAQARDMDLSAAKFAPKVIELFEKAKEESRGGSAKAASGSAPEAGSGGGGGGKALLIGGGVVAAAGVTALVVAGGGGDDGGPGGTQTSSGTVGGTGREESYLVVTPTKAGTLEATITWQNASQQLGVGCHENDPPYTPCDQQLTRTSGTSAVMRANVQQKAYLMNVSNYSGSPEAFTLTVRLP